MIFPEEGEANAFKVHDANHAVAEDQRDGYFRPYVEMRRNVTRVFRNVRNVDDLAGRSSSAGNSFAHFNVFGRSRLIVITLAEAATEKVAIFLDEINAEGVE